MLSLHFLDHLFLFSIAKVGICTDIHWVSSWFCRILLQCQWMPKWIESKHFFVFLRFTILTFAVFGTLISMVVVGFLITSTCHVHGVCSALWLRGRLWFPVDRKLIRTSDWNKSKWFPCAIWLEATIWLEGSTISVFLLPDRGPCCFHLCCFDLSSWSSCP